MSRISLHDVKLPPNLLKDIGLDEMVKLSGDDGAFLEFFDGLDLEDIKNAQIKRQDLSDEILQAAVLNCDKEPSFEEKKTQLRSKLLKMVDLKNEHKEKYEELKSLTTVSNTDAVLKDLQKALRDTEKNSEEMADRYVAGSSELDCDAFVADFQEKRTLYWLRKVKAEKMEELVKNMRPVAAPRSPRNPREHIAPPYVAPMPGQSLPPTVHQAPYPPGPTPAHSIPPGPQKMSAPVYSNPPGHSIHVPHGPRRTSNPTHSMPPYNARVPMPQPHQPHANHPFPAAAFPNYRPPYPPQPYGSYPSNAYR